MERQGGYMPEATLETTTASDENAKMLEEMLRNAKPAEVQGELERNPIINKGTDSDAPVPMVGRVLHTASSNLPSILISTVSVSLRSSSICAVGRSTSDRGACACAASGNALKMSSSAAGETRRRARVRAIEFIYCSLQRNSD